MRFDMTVINDMNRFQLLMGTVDRLPLTGDMASSERCPS